MGRVAEGSRRNYETLRLGIQDLFRHLSIIIARRRTGSSYRLRGKVHMPFKQDNREARLP